MATPNNQLPAQQKPKFSVAITTKGYQSLISNTLRDPTRARRFTASITSAVAVNPALQECDAGTILAGALLGESLNLSPSPQLGQYYLVPFKQKAKYDRNNRLIRPEITTATFVLGYKGYVQLALRSGQYADLDVMEIKEGEYLGKDSLTGKAKFQFIEDDDQRDALPTVGYMVDILVATGSKNGSISVAGTDVAIKGLAALAYKAKISQSDLDDALAAVLAAKADKATTLGGYGITDAYTKDEINAKISAVYKPAGSVVFSALPALAENVLGNVYNVTDAFTTTNNFVEGAGNKYPKGTNVVVVKVGDAYKYDVLAGFVDLSGYVEKEAGKGLSDENFTAALKDKLNGIEAGANKYVHPTHTAAASGLYKTTVDEEGHVTNTIPVTKDDITGLGIPAQDTTYDEATTAKAGLMSAADKTKLDGMDTTIDKAIADHTATDAEVSEMLAEIYGE